MPLTLLIASDTHGRPDRLLEAYRRVDPAATVFLGDGLRDLLALPQQSPIYAVRGNCDWSADADAPPSRVVEIGSYRLYLTHGHLHGVKLQLDAAIAAAAAADADALLYGHTHIPFEQNLRTGTQIVGGVLRKPLLVLCPGSLGQPADGVPSFATLTLTDAGLLAGFGKLK